MTDTYLIASPADEVRAVAELLDATGPQAVTLTPAQSRAIAVAFQHIADDMDDYGAHEEPLERVDGTFTTIMRDESGGYRFDWTAGLRAARALHGETQQP